MCLIIASNGKATSAPDKFVISSALRSNPDGAGIVFPKPNGRLSIYRTLSPDPDVFLSLIDQLVKDGTPFVFHARYATHGLVNLANCHPVQVSPEVAIAHNGVCSNWGSHTISDTRHILKTFGANKHVDFYHDPEFGSKLHKAGGSYNKFAVLDSTGKLTIHGESLGGWDPDTGLWYSDPSQCSDYEWPTFTGYRYYDPQKPNQVSAADRGYFETIKNDDGTYRSRWVAYTADEQDIADYYGESGIHYLADKQTNIDDDAWDRFTSDIDPVGYCAGCCHTITWRDMCESEFCEKCGLNLEHTGNLLMTRSEYKLVDHYDDRYEDKE